MIVPYKNGLIYHKTDMSDLEYQLKRFPRGKHDDIVDSLQMLYEMMTLSPWTNMNKQNQFRFERDEYGTPILIQ